jgi:hypothetical protein
MRITLTVQRHAGLVKDNRNHFLLSDASLVAKVGFEDGSYRSFAAVKGSGPGTLVVELQPDDHPPGAAATQLDLVYTVTPTLGGKRFTALRVSQRLLVAAPPESDRPRFAPGGWHDALGRLRVSNRLTHPLVDLSSLDSGQVEVNTLILDITEGWSVLHTDNVFSQLHDEVMRDSPLRARVFAHTAGTPLIWHAVVPRHLGGARAVAPHIFLQPSDNREGQNRESDEAYLTKNDEHFKADGKRLMKYILPPIADVDVRRREQKFPSAPYWRNVLCVQPIPSGPRKGQITPLQWSIPAGLQRAFEHQGEGRPAQFLLLPQRTGQPNSAASGWYGAAVTRHVLRTTAAILNLIQTNTDFTLTGGDTLLERDKLVYSGYSESGFDLWNVGRLLADHLKAIVAIEPQNLNEIQNDYRSKEGSERVGQAPALGKRVIPHLLRKGIKVFIIGRHHTAKYRPEVAPAASLRLLPKDPGSVFAFPPDPSANDFVKYRIQRLLDPILDPLMTDEERGAMKSLSDRGLRGQQALAKILTPEANVDRGGGDGYERWYSHQFALSGGDQLTFDTKAMYGTPVQYRTWFQVATHEIG